jgi:hypothetical protein
MENNNLFLRLFIRQTMTESYEQFEKEMLKTEQTSSETQGTIQEQSAEPNGGKDNSAKENKEE